MDRRDFLKLTIGLAGLPAMNLDKLLAQAVAADETGEVLQLIAPHEQEESFYCLGHATAKPGKNSVLSINGPAGFYQVGCSVASIGPQEVFNEMIGISLVTTPGPRIMVMDCFNSLNTYTMAVRDFVCIRQNERLTAIVEVKKKMFVSVMMLAKAKVKPTTCAIPLEAK